MSISLSSNVHIEMSVRDVHRAYEFLHNALGAGKIEQVLVSHISYVDYMEIVHVGLGEVILQFVKSAVDGPHAKYLSTIGPCVSNLNFFVDETQSANTILAQEGIVPAYDFGMALMPWKDMLGPENTKPDDQMGNGYYLNAKDKIGFDLELAERPWKPGARQEIFYPAYVHPRPEITDRVQPLRRIRIVVDDLDRVLGLLKRSFDATPVESDAWQGAYRSGIKTAQVILGGLRLEYCQPISDTGLLSEFLKQQGNGVFSLIYGVSNIKDTLGEMGNTGESATSGAFLDSEKLYGSGSATLGYRIECRPILGFDIELEEVV